MRPNRQFGMAKRKQKNIVKLSIRIDVHKKTYLYVLACRQGLTIESYVSSLIDNEIREEILTGRLDMEIPHFEYQNKVMKNIIKALIYGELNDNEKLDITAIRDISVSLGCKEDDILKLFR